PARIYLMSGGPRAVTLGNATVAAKACFQYGDYPLRNSPTIPPTKLLPTLPAAKEITAIPRKPALAKWSPTSELITMAEIAPITPPHIGQFGGPGIGGIKPAGRGAGPRRIRTGGPRRPETARPTCAAPANNRRNEPINHLESFRCYANTALSSRCPGGKN